MKTCLATALASLLLLVACGNEIPEVKFDGLTAPADTGPDMPKSDPFKKCDLLITELMPAPANKDVEWLEILNTTSKEQDLAGVALKMWHKDSTKPTTVVLGTDAKTKVAAGGRLLVCGCDSTGKTSTDIPCYAPTDCKKISMVNSADASTGYTVQLMAGTEVVHSVVYGKTGGIPGPKSSGGGSIRLAGEVTAATMCGVSDKATSWCTDPAEATYDTAAANKGTPGKANGNCCIYTPRMGDLRINEALTNAPGPEENEWVELFVANAPGPAGELDLYKMRLVYNKTGDKSSALAAVKATDICLRVKKGDYPVLARKPKVVDTCNPTVTFNIGSTASMVAAQSTLAIEDDRTGKEVTTRVVITNGKLGLSKYYDSATKAFAATSADVKYKYCDVTSTAGKQEIGYGTPGKVNISGR
jgi:hypothetical protein